MEQQPKLNKKGNPILYCTLCGIGMKRHNNLIYHKKCNDKNTVCHKLGLKYSYEFFDLFTGEPSKYRKDVNFDEDGNMIYQ